MNTNTLATEGRLSIDPSLKLNQLPRAIQAPLSDLVIPAKFINTEPPKTAPAPQPTLYKKIRDDVEFKAGTSMTDVISGALIAALKHEPEFKKAVEAALKEKKDGADTFLRLMADSGFMIDVNAFADGKLKKGAYPLIEVIGQNKSPNQAVLSKLFPEKKDSLGDLKIYYVKGDTPMGFTLGNLASVNTEATSKMHKQVQDIMTAAAKISPLVAFTKIPKESFQESVEVNELAHLALHTLYKFDSAEEHDWSKVASGIKGYTIPNSLNAHEFISDCASALIPEGGVPLLYAKYLNGGKNDGYAYSHALLENHLDGICRRHKTTLPDLKDVSSISRSDYFLLSLTTPDDVKALQTAYLDQSKVLMAEIRGRK